jgi:hypothetical protein
MDEVKALGLKAICKKVWLLVAVIYDPIRYTGAALCTRATERQTLPIALIRHPFL